MYDESKVPYCVLYCFYAELYNPTWRLLINFYLILPYLKVSSLFKSSIQQVRFKQLSSQTRKAVTTFCEHWFQLHWQEAKKTMFALSFWFHINVYILAAYPGIFQCAFSAISDELVVARSRKGLRVGFGYLLYLDMLQSSALWLTEHISVSFMWKGWKRRLSHQAFSANHNDHKTLRTM